MSETTMERIYGGCWIAAVLLGFIALAVWMFGPLPLAVLVGKVALLCVASAIGTSIVAILTGEG